MESTTPEEHQASEKPTDLRTTTLPRGAGADPSYLPQAGGCASGAANGDEAAEISYVYALGRVEARFRTLAAEKEFAQATGRADTKGLTDRQTFRSVLSQRENRYLARQMCYVLTIEGLETYILVPSEPADLDLLIEAIRPNPSDLDIDVVIGTRGSLAPPELCNGLMLPIVTFDQIYSFDREALIKAIPKPDRVAAKEFASASGDLFDRIMQITDNAGATDEHRALNYLALRYPAIYARAAECHALDFSMTAFDVRPSRLSGVRNILDVIFSFTNRKTDVLEKYFVRVDVTEEFPFLVSKLTLYFDR
jgi:PatG Domain